MSLGFFKNKCRHTFLIHGLLKGSITAKNKRPRPGQFPKILTSDDQMNFRAKSIEVLLVFSVTPFKTDQNKNQNRSINKV